MGDQRLRTWPQSRAILICTSMYMERVDANVDLNELSYYQDYIQVENLRRLSGGDFLRRERWSLMSCTPESPTRSPVIGT
ncbi:hypothetical protein L596_020685 [Steinernema carpocapsae]|uniref:Uncharacterized protein n=1 Tax=Steinernema carpocapsae TaxID=34508 RepID=A0A4U5MUB1_STECR|nr:hypothetical protein L596_020685 [Steinernema carpocapsae]